MADEQEVIKLEHLCKQLNEASDNHLRQEAEKALVDFQSGTGNTSDTLSLCQRLLDRANSSYSQYVAATTLTKMVAKSPCNLTLDQRMHIRNYVLEYLKKQTSLVHYVKQGLIVLYTRITKNGWYDTDQKGNYVFRDPFDNISSFLSPQASLEERTVAVEILARLTLDMNIISDSEANRALTKCRKTSASYRDQYLFNVLEYSCLNLREANSANDFSTEARKNYTMQLIQLALNCLTFDFFGTSVGDSGEDFCTVQIPITWRQAFLDFTTVQLFFDLYAKTTPELASLCLAVLVQIASFRRTFFNVEERLKFLNRLVTGVKSILQNPHGLRHTLNYHEFCRLLLRLKSNFQLSELILVEDYAVTIELITKFTVDSLRTWRFETNSLHYLLSLWQRMVGSVPYMKDSTEPHLLDLYTPEVFRAYVVSQMENVLLVQNDSSLEDPLQDLIVVSQQLEQLSTIGRCEYGKNCELLRTMFGEAAQRYQDLLSSGGDVRVLEPQLTWLVYIIGAVLAGRTTYSNVSDCDAMDGELVCRVLQLMNLTEGRLIQGEGCEGLEMANIAFFNHFRKIYIGDQIQKYSKFYSRLSEILGLSDETMILAVFARKIIINIKYWGHSEKLLYRTLKLFAELSLGHSSVRKMVKIEEMQFVLNNHTSDQFSFLGTECALKDMRARTLFYSSLGRLGTVEIMDNEEEFRKFMMPLTNVVECLGSMLQRGETTDACKRRLVGLVRDLRGLVEAFTSKMSYLNLWEWLFPTYSGIILRGLEVWGHEHEVSTPVLKLFQELAQNKGQRLLFDVSSPNGVLLFREISKVIVTYGNRLLVQAHENIPSSEVYARRYKGISVCFSMLKAALSGNYVNFGVMRLYGDDALDSALHMFTKLLLSVPADELTVYPKLSQNYYGLLECLSQDHIAFIDSLEPHIIIYMLGSISEGLSAIDTTVCNSSVSALDNFVTYLYKQVHHKSSKAPEHRGIARVMEHHPQILHQMMSTVMHIFMFETCRNQWSMGRPLLPLILLNSEFFTQLRQQLVSQQMPDKQGAMVELFEHLMDGIQPNLQARNRDKFTQNLATFRRDLNNASKESTTATVSHMTNNVQMMTL